jgi:hypothetical protein
MRLGRTGAASGAGEGDAEAEAEGPLRLGMPRIL